jgi:small-conductance mechanosensitive channel
MKGSHIHKQATLIWQGVEMPEVLKQFLLNDIIEFGTYGVSILDILIIVPIIFVDLTIFRVVNKLLKKRRLLEKPFVKALAKIFRWILHFLAFIGIMSVIGVKIENIFDFIYAVLNFKLFTIANTHISLLTIIVMVVVVYVSAKLSKVVRNYFDKSVFPRFNIEEGLRFSLSKFAGYLVIAIGVIIALQGLGVKLSALAVFAGVLGVGIGFGMQSITANIVSGIVILFERPIKEGDMIRLSNTIGEVLKINLRSSIIRTIYNEHLIVPNSDFINGVVENMSWGDIRLRLSVKVGVSYGSDPFVVQKALIEAAERTDNVMNNPEPTVLFRDFGDSSLNFELLAWIENPALRFITESSIRFTIVKIFGEYGIAIPFPQRDVYIKTMPREQ